MKSHKKNSKKNIKIVIEIALMIIAIVLGTYALYMWIDNNWNNSSDLKDKKVKETENGKVSAEPVNAVTLVNSLGDGSSVNKYSRVYKVEHDAIPAESSATGSEIPAVTDYRYYGSSPSNYICLDMEGGSTCPDKHLYRIIGSIYEELSGQNLIKVIKATPLTDGTTSKFSWDYKLPDRIYNNVWSSNTSGTDSGSSSMKLLNEMWFTNGSGDSYNNNNYTVVHVDFTNYGLSNKAKSHIVTSRYYLGGYSNPDVKTSEMYLAERGTTTSSGNANYWDGKIGLMYPSDYGYAVGNACVDNTSPVLYYQNCYKDDWMFINEHEWTITPFTAYTSTSIFLGYGYLDRYDTYVSFDLRPSFYLSKDVVIIGGTGRDGNPYLIG